MTIPTNQTLDKTTRPRLFYNHSPPYLPRLACTCRASLWGAAAGICLHCNLAAGMVGIRTRRIGALGQYYF